MGIKQILIDDFDGAELAEDTPATTLSFKGWTYTLYLSEKNLSALEADIAKWTANVEPETTGKYAITVTKAKKATGSSINTYGHDTKDVRAWAVKKKIKNDNGKPVGDRGRISQSVYDAYNAEHAA